MQPRVTTVGPLAAASATAIAASQTVTAGHNFVLNGADAANGVAVLDNTRQINITSAGNDSGITFTIFGTDGVGNPISETITGANAGASTSFLAYATVTQITPSAAPASTVEAGTTATSWSPWIFLDSWAAGTVSGQCVAIGTVNYTVQVSDDDPNFYPNPIPPSQMAWDSDAAGVNAATASGMFGLSYAPQWVRVLLNSGSGSVRMTLVQHSSVPY